MIYYKKKLKPEEKIKNEKEVKAVIKKPKSPNVKKKSKNK